MATLMQNGERLLGFMCGTTLGYLAAVMLNIDLRSWPVNGVMIFFAVIMVLLHGPDWWRMFRRGGAFLRHGLGAGLLLMGALWLLYFR
ncbi:MAG: hypothetical protein AAAB16_01285 [Pseudomonas sp.]|uniref:hypothetical protein n=1 Tax=Pseudomonas sp. TaxID=306 RepID=UPI0030F10E7A